MITYNDISMWNSVFETRSKHRLSSTCALHFVFQDCPLTAKSECVNAARRDSVTNSESMFEYQPLNDFVDNV